MKKLLKPEMEFIKFNTEDVITTSGEKVDLASKNATADDANGKANTQEYTGLQWNMQ